MRRSTFCAWAFKTFGCNRMTVGRHSLKPTCLGRGSRHLPELAEQLLSQEPRASAVMRAGCSAAERNEGEDLQITRMQAEGRADGPLPFLSGCRSGSDDQRVAECALPHCLGGMARQSFGLLEVGAW